MNYFVFKGVDSREFKSIIVNQLPSIIKPAERIDQYVVDGRSGNLNISNGAYDPVIKSVECTVKDLKEIDLITEWLRGSGEVIFSNQPDRFYRGIILNQIPFDRVIRQFRTFIIEFECQPTAQSIYNDYPIVLNKPGLILGEGNTESEPIIKVYGTGDGQLIINDNVIVLEGIEEYISIDSRLLQCYKDKTPQGRKMKGFYPSLSHKENNIRWTGGITKVEIIPNWSWL